jgi:hypothetical protein
VLAFEHEVDAKEGGGEDVEEVREPEGQRGEDVAGGGIEVTGGALGDGVDAELVGEGTMSGMRWGRSEEKLRRSLSTGGRPVVKKSARKPDTAAMRMMMATPREGL